MCDILKWCAVAGFKRVAIYVKKKGKKTTTIVGNKYLYVYMKSYIICNAKKKKTQADAYYLVVYLLRV